MSVHVQEYKEANPQEYDQKERKIRRLVERLLLNISSEHEQNVLAGTLIQGLAHENGMRVDEIPIVLALFDAAVHIFPQDIYVSEIKLLLIRFVLETIKKTRK